MARIQAIPSGPGTAWRTSARARSTSSPVPPKRPTTPPTGPGASPECCCDAAARGLAALPYDRLAGLCPPGAEDDEALEALEGARGLYEELVEYFGAAARDGHAVLVWQL
ncbi:hypothetical protein RM704_33270 [Streptomyces sp. DSM 3412]|uniref:DUF1877 family protein n=1 Tax=Streptomyces gottesmaniae TaxID=3075518 RepID=A0ABU2Z6Q6_9ACTN|nr:hypothetical protein [Streptomyces sp. DSM 3412]MDT0572273.1 hypothetical protein [Streptomyces sp. DSM 3412]